MNKWINVESVINKFSMYVGFTTRPDMMRAIQIIKDEPGIDIVRCGECKHWDDRRNDAWWSEEGACDRTSRLGNATYRNHDDFCSYGERREP